MKVRQSESFVWMSDTAGGTGSQKGVIYAGGTWDFAKNAYLRMDEQYAVDVFNTFYVDGKYPIAIDDKTSLALGAQYYPQSSVGDAQIGSFSTFGMGLQAAVAYGPVGVQLYYTQTGKGFDTQSPFGDHASYLNLMQVAFNTAGEKAWAIGGNVNFADLGVPGLTAAAIYADGRDRIDDQTGSPHTQPQRDQRPRRLRDRQGDLPRGAGGHVPLLVAASGWLAADRDPASRLPQLRGPLLTHGARAARQPRRTSCGIMLRQRGSPPFVWDNRRLGVRGLADLSRGLGAETRPRRRGVTWRSPVFAG